MEGWNDGRLEGRKVGNFGIMERLNSSKSRFVDCSFLSN
jgi:hypothetical protein